MKIQIVKKDLLDKIILLSRFTSSRFTNNPILQGVLFEFKSKKLSLYATNLTSFAHSTLSLNKQVESVSVVVEVKKLIEFLNLISQQTIELDVLENKLSITINKTKATFPVLKGSDFPKLNTKNKTEVDLGGEFFFKNISLVLFSASKDDTRPVLSGVYFTKQDNGFINMVSTDGFRLSVLKAKNKEDIDSMIIPAGFLNEVLYFIKTFKKKVKFYVSKEDNIAMFLSDEFSFYTRLIDGEFPPFEKVIPNDINTTITISRDSILKAVKTTSVLLQGGSNIVVFDVRDDGVYFMPKNKDIDGDNVVFQEASISGGNVKIAFNNKFVLDLLNNLNVKDIKIEISKSDSPAIFTTKEKPGFLHLIMPIRIEI